MKTAIVTGGAQGIGLEVGRQLAGLASGSTAQRARTNPRALRKDIYDAVDQLHALPNAEPGITESVFDSLVPPQPHPYP